MYTQCYMFMHSPSLLITSPACASWVFCLIRDAWCLCLHGADERSAANQQNGVETKGFFLLRSHIGAVWKTAVPLPGVSNSLDPIHRASRWFMKISKGKMNGRGHQSSACLAKPLLLFTLSLAAQMPIQITGILEQWSHRGCTPVTSYSNWSGQMTFQHPQI